MADSPVGLGSTWPWNPGLTRPGTQTVPIRAAAWARQCPAILHGMQWLDQVVTGK